MHDDAKSNPAFPDAASRLIGADQIFFLGFGFGEQNAERLQLRRIPDSVSIYCTSFGMTRAEIGTLIQNAFQGRALTVRAIHMDGTESIQQYLREFIPCFR